MTTNPHSVNTMKMPGGSIAALIRVLIMNNLGETYEQEQIKVTWRS
jgi:hypothetical protein